MSEEALEDHIFVRLERQLQDYVEVRNPKSTAQLLEVMAKFEERYSRARKCRVRGVAIMWPCDNVGRRVGMSVGCLMLTADGEIGEMRRKNYGLPPDNPEAYRFVLDYRKLNAITKYQRYPLPLKDDFITNIPHTAIMSSLDRRSGYFQLAVNPSDVVKTAFLTKNGRNLITPFQKLVMVSDETEFAVGDREKLYNPPTEQHGFFHPTREALKTDHTEFFLRSGTHQK
ncbi:uncharacterized protein TNCV_2715001 [Trichonephila clavipes]|nr:uncharacterized protein TNCV_2715001 [Trichonephila clavipes]